MRKVTRTVAVLILLMSLSGFALADAFDVFVPTSGLTAGGQFTLDFNLIDGSGPGNTSVTISNFNFDSAGGGGAAGSASLFGSASGDASTGFSLSDTVFGEAQQAFNPGQFLSFDIFTAAGVDAGGVPDVFTFAILELVTDPSGQTNSLVTLSFDAANPTLTTASATNFLVSDGNGGFTVGNKVNGVSPAVTPVPEPASLFLLGGGASLLLASRRKKTA